MCVGACGGGCVGICMSACKFICCASGTVQLYQVLRNAAA